MRLACLFIFAVSCLLTSAAGPSFVARHAPSPNPSEGAKKVEGQAFTIKLDIDNNTFSTTRASISSETLVSRFARDLARRSNNGMQSQYTWASTTYAVDTFGGQKSSSGIHLVQVPPPYLTEDTVYYADAQIGTGGPQRMRLVMSTGNPESWVVGPRIVHGEAEPEGVHKYYNPDRSRSAIEVGPCTISYPDAVVTGTWVVDRVVLGRDSNTMDIVATSFCVAESLPDFFHPSKYHADGILGLAPPTTMESDGDTSTPFLQNLVDAEALLENVMTFKIIRAFGQSELSLGRISELGVTQTVTLNVHEFSQGPPQWAVMVERISYEDAAIFQDAQLAYFETGTTFIELPVAITTELFSHAYVVDVVVTTHKDGSVYYAFPCDTRREVSFNISGWRLNLQLNVLIVGRIEDKHNYCISGIVGTTDNYMTFGQVFIENYYTSFRFPPGKRLTIDLGNRSGVQIRRATTRFKNGGL